MHEAAGRKGVYRVEGEEFHYQNDTSQYMSGYW